MGEFVDLTGRKFGMLTVIGYAGKNKNGTIMWTCQCDCGNETNSISAKLNNGHKKSCGCYRMIFPVLTKTKHGHSRSDYVSPEYIAWENMIQRCNRKADKRYKDYGGRGIKVCDRWLSNFKDFLTDMGKRPSKQHSIDRINVNGNYEPSNCRWATIVEQARNTRTRCDNTSGCRGVYWHLQLNKWATSISVNKKRIFIGSFNQLSEAIEARKQAELKYWGKEAG